MMDDRPGEHVYRGYTITELGKGAWWAVGAFGFIELGPFPTAEAARRAVDQDVADARGEVDVR